MLIILHRKLRLGMLCLTLNGPTCLAAERSTRSEYMNRVVTPWTVLLCLIDLVRSALSDVSMQVRQVGFLRLHYRTSGAGCDHPDRGIGHFLLSNLRDLLSGAIVIL